MIRRIVPASVRGFFSIAQKANITGLASMIAYDMLLGVIPLAFVALFIASKVLTSASVEARVISDLREVFLGTADSTLNSLLAEVRERSTSTGILAIASSLWARGRCRLTSLTSRCSSIRSRSRAAACSCSAAW